MSSEKRYISNHDDLVIFLKNNMFNIIYPDNMTLYERFCSLSYKKYIIVEAGATLVNLYFLENLNDTKVIVLCNENMYKFHGIYEDQIRHYCRNVSIIIGDMENSNNEKSNAYTNYPYIINIKYIQNILN
jgi:capsular polysaccharide biosynthesis protein